MREKKLKCLVHFEDKNYAMCSHSICFSFNVFSDNAHKDKYKAA